MIFINLQHIFLLVSLISVSYCGCPQFPNGTYTKVNWWECVQGNLTISSINILTENGNSEYPVQFRKAFYVSIDGENHGMPFTEPKLSMTVWTFGGWMGCSWHEVPTFGMLNNLDACKYGAQCPIPTGKINVKAKIDASRDTMLFSLLKNNATYQVRYSITDNKTKEQICVVVQARCLTEETTSTDI
uniref:ML domain-containing protein n=1 Tax=Strongyloides venezuelensis TaxID=75913 RepID=A0A0K0FF92_STRVS